MMKANQINFIDGLFSNNDTYLIPCYQRPYAWDDENCEMLWGDIKNLMTHKNFQEHFMGTIILFDVNDDENYEPKQYWVIDGQQRITTIYVLLKALFDLVVENGNNELLATRIKMYLYNSSQLKVIPKENDIAVLQNIFFHTHELLNPTDLNDAYDYFKKEINDFCLKDNRYDEVFAALCKLTAVKEVFFFTDYEDPHAVFEHVNADRKELTLTDKVRNFLLLSDKYMVARTLYNLVWRPMEEKFIDHFDDKKRQEKLDDYVFKFLQLKIPGISKRNAYERFRIHLTELIIEQEQPNINLEHAKTNDNFAYAPNSIAIPDSNLNFDDGENDEEQENSNEPLSTADDIRLCWLNELIYYSYFYIIFNCDYYDDNSLNLGRKEAKLGKEPYRFIYHAYSWNIRLMLYWFRMLENTSHYVLFFKLFEWEDKGKITQETLEKILYLILNYTIRWTIISESNKCPSDSAYNAILPTIYFQNNIDENGINNQNCYQFFVQYFKEYTKEQPDQLFASDEQVMDALKENNITNINLLYLLFLLIYYDTLLFNENKFYTKSIYLIYILPDINIEEFSDTCWLEKDSEHDWTGLSLHELDWLLKNLVNRIGNLGIIEEKIWDKIAATTKNRDKTNHIAWFLLPSNDFYSKKRFFSLSIFADSSYEVMLESNDWKAVDINKRTFALAKKILKCLTALLGEDDARRN